MELKQVNIDEIKPYPNNAKIHPEEQIKALANQY